MRNRLLIPLIWVAIFALTTNILAQDFTQSDLPEGAKARLDKDAISEIVYSPDGKHLAVASGTEIWLYDAQTGEEVDLLAEHPDAVISIAFSPDGKTLMSAGSDGLLGTVHLWNVATNSKIRTLTAHTGAINVAFSNDYRLRLQEKQKLRFNYGITERQLRRIVREAVQSKTLTDDKIIELLERRLDNVVFRGGLAPTIPAARQLVNHKHILVNKKRVNIASYRVKVGDVIQPREKSIKLEPIQTALLDGPELNYPEWLEFDESTTSIRTVSLPNADSAPFPLELSLVVEFYSRLL